MVNVLQRFASAIVIFLPPLLTSFAGCTGSTGGGGTHSTEPAAPTTSASSQELLDEFAAGLLSVASKVGTVGQHTDAEEWDAARQTNHDAQVQLRGLNQRLKQVQYQFDADDARSLRVTLEMWAALLDFMGDGIVWVEEILPLANHLDAATTADEALNDLYALELTLDSGEVVARGADAIAAKIEFLVATDPELASRLNYGASLAQTFRDSAAGVRGDLSTFEDLIEDAIHEFESEYVEPENRALPKDRPVPAPPSSLVSEDVHQFFVSFDANADGELSINEAKTFYAWVEAHIIYRYDNEAEENPYPGYSVGDGRAGPDYQQTPTETYTERLGDCEDMNTLEVAFYNSWGVTAYQAYVNVVDAYEYDHAIAIVLLGASLEEARAIVGKLDYYHFDEENRWGIPPGYYMIVDNAYSDGFGAVSGGIEPGRFQVFEVHRLGEDLQSYVS